jgi:hypothetical protein
LEAPAAPEPFQLRWHPLEGQAQQYRGRVHRSIETLVADLLKQQQQAVERRVSRIHFDHRVGVASGPHGKRKRV